MSKKDDMLETTVADEANVEYFDLDAEEKNELGGLVALVNQARLAQDLLFTRLLHSAAQKRGVQDSLLEMNIGDVFAQGVEVAKLKATKTEKPEEDKQLEEVAEADPASEGSTQEAEPEKE